MFLRVASSYGYEISSRLYAIGKREKIEKIVKVLSKPKDQQAILDSYIATPLICVLVKKLNKISKFFKKNA